MVLLTDVKVGLAGIRFVFSPRFCSRPGLFQSSARRRLLRISFLDGRTWQNGFFNGWDTTTVGVLCSFTVKAGSFGGWMCFGWVERDQKWSELEWFVQWCKKFISIQSRTNRFREGWSTFYILALLDSVLKNIGEACAVLVIYAAQAGTVGVTCFLMLRWRVGALDVAVGQNLRYLIGDGYHMQPRYWAYYSLFSRVFGCSA